MAGNKKDTMLAWEALAGKELKGQALDSLTRKTPEGIEIKPLYTVDDLATIDHVNTFPGIPPLVRGPRATSRRGKSILP